MKNAENYYHKIKHSSPEIIIELREHEKFPSEHVENIKRLNVPFCSTEYEEITKYLGVDKDSLCASYYIGATWLTDQHAMIVRPKVDNLDFIEMYSSALKFKPAAEYFSKF